MTDTEKQTAEAMLRAIFLRPDLTPESREQFIQEMMAGKTELTIQWDDLCTMAGMAAQEPAPGARQLVCVPNCYWGDCPPCVAAGIAPGKITNRAYGRFVKT